MTPADEQLKSVVAMGRAIRLRVEQADLEGAGMLAAERQRKLAECMARRREDLADETLAYWLQEILREDRQLMTILDGLRERLESEFGAARRGAQSVRQYMETAES